MNKSILMNAYINKYAKINNISYSSLKNHARL